MLSNYYNNPYIASATLNEPAQGVDDTDETSSEGSLSQLKQKKLETLKNKKDSLLQRDAKLAEINAERRNVQEDISPLDGYVPTNTKEFSSIVAGVGQAAIDTYGLSRVGKAGTPEYDSYVDKRGNAYSGDIGTVAQRDATGGRTVHLLPSVVADTVQSISKIVRGPDDIIDAPSGNKEDDVYRFKGEQLLNEGLMKNQYRKAQYTDEEGNLAEATVNNPAYTPVKIKPVEDAAREAQLEKESENMGLLDRIINDVPKAFAAGALTAPVTTVDAVAEGASKLASEATGKDLYLDIGKSEDLKNSVNDLVGYNNARSKAIMKEVGDLYDKSMEKVEFLDPSTWSNMDVGSLGKAVATAFSTAETASYSLGNIMGHVFGGGAITSLGKGALKLGSKEAGQDVAEKGTVAATSATTAGKNAAGEIEVQDVNGNVLGKTAAADAGVEAAEKATKEATEVATSRATQIKDALVAGTPAALSMGVSLHNEAMDKYVEANDGVRASIAHDILGIAGNTMAAMIDVGVTKSIIAQAKAGATAREVMAATGSKEVGLALVKGVAAGGLAMVGAGIKEFPQEYVQSYVEAFDGAYGAGGTTAEEANKVAMREGGIGAIAGLAAGAQLKGAALAYGNVAEVAGPTVGAVTSGLGSIGDKFKSKPEPTDTSSVTSTGTPKLSAEDIEVHKAEYKQVLTDLVKATPTLSSSNVGDLADKVSRLHELRFALRDSSPEAVATADTMVSEVRTKIKELITSDQGIKLTKTQTEAITKDLANPSQATAPLGSKELNEAVQTDEEITAVSGATPEQSKQSASYIAAERRHNAEALIEFVLQGEAKENINVLGSKLVKFAEANGVSKPRLEEIVKTYETVEDEVLHSYSGVNRFKATLSKEMASGAPNSEVLTRDYAKITNWLSTTRSSIEQLTDGIALARTKADTMNRAGGTGAYKGKTQVVPTGYMKDDGKAFEINIVSKNGKWVPQLEEASKLITHKTSTLTHLTSLVTDYNTKAYDYVPNMVNVSQVIVPTKTTIDKKTGKEVTKSQLRDTMSLQSKVLEEVGKPSNFTRIIVDEEIEEPGWSTTGALRKTNNAIINREDYNADDVVMVVAGKVYEKKDKNGKASAIPSIMTNNANRAVNGLLAKAIAAKATIVLNHANIPFSYTGKKGKTDKNKTTNKDFRYLNAFKLAMKIRGYVQLDTTNNDTKGVASYIFVPKDADIVAKLEEVERVNSTFKESKDAAEANKQKLVAATMRHAVIQDRVNKAKDVENPTDTLLEEIDKDEKALVELEKTMAELTHELLPLFSRKAKETVISSEDGSDSITLTAIEDSTDEENTDSNTPESRLLAHITGIINKLVKEYKDEKLINDAEGVVTVPDVKYKDLISYTDLIDSKLEETDSAARELMQGLKDILESQNSPLESDENAEVVTSSSKDADVNDLLVSQNIQADVKGIAQTMVDTSIGNSGNRTQDVYEWTWVEANPKEGSIPQYITQIKYSMPTEEDLGKETEMEFEEEETSTEEKEESSEGLATLDFDDKGNVTTTEAKPKNQKPTMKDKKTGKSKKVVLAKVRKVELNPANYVHVNKTTTLNTIPFDNLHSDVQGIANSFEFEKAIPALTEGEANFDKSLVEGRGRKPTQDQLKAMEESERTAEISRSKKAQQAFYAINSPARSLIFNDEGKIHKNVKAAMAMAMYALMDTDKFKLTLGPKSDTDIASMYNITEAEVTDDMRKMAREQGMLAKSVADTIGKATLGLLGIGRKQLEGVNKGEYERLIADLGNMTIEVGITMGLLEEKEVSSNKIAQAMKETILSSEDKSITRFINLKSTLDKKTNKQVINKEALAKIALIKKVQETFPDRINPLKGPLTAAIPDNVKNAQLNQVRNDLVGAKVPEEAQETLTHMMNTPYSVDVEGIKEFLEAYDNSDYTDGILSSLGYIKEGSPTYEKLLLNDKIIQESINDNVVKSIEQLRELYEMVQVKGDDISLYFVHYYTANGRFMLDSNTINPQTNKLHRFFVQPKAHTRKYKVVNGNLVDKDSGKNMSYLLRYAIAQAAGVGTDKVTAASIIETSDALLSLNNEELDKLNERILLDGEAYVKYNDKVHKVSADHLSHTLQAIRLLKDLNTVKDGANFITSSITAEFDALTSGFSNKVQQFPILDDMEQHFARVGIYSSAFTNGALPIGPTTGMNDVLAGDFTDSYQSLAGIAMEDVNSLTTSPKDNPSDKDKVGVIKNAVSSGANDVYADSKATLFAALKESDALPAKEASGKISKALRTLFKAPFMIFNYSASISNIRKSLSASMANDILTGVAAGDSNAFTAFDAIIKGSVSEATKVTLVHTIRDDKNNEVTTKISSALELQKLLRTVPVTQIKIKANKNSKTLVDLLEESMNNTYGAAVEAAFNKQFKPFIEIQDLTNDLFKAGFRVFSKKLTEVLKEKYSDNGVVTEAQFKEAVDSVYEYFPKINGPLTGKNNEEDAATEKKNKDLIHVYTSTILANNTDVRAFASSVSTRTMNSRSTTTKNKANKGEAKRSIASIVKVLGEAANAGSVLPFHFIDGAEIGGALNSFVKYMNGESSSTNPNSFGNSSGAGITPIHDAIMPPLYLADQATWFYNESDYKVNKNYVLIDELVSYAEYLKNVVEKEKPTLDFKGDGSAVTHSLDVLSTKGMKHNKVVKGDRTSADLPFTSIVKKLHEELVDKQKAVHKARVEYLFPDAKNSTNEEPVKVAISAMVGMPSSVYVTGQNPLKESDGTIKDYSTDFEYTDNLAIPSLTNLTPSEVTTKDGKPLVTKEEAKQVDETISKLQKASTFPRIADSLGLFDKIKTRLKQYYPEIHAEELDKVFDDNGVEALGKAVGMAVQYSRSKGSIDTLPHEYAHVYVDMLKGTGFVKQLLSKIQKQYETTAEDAEEILVSHMGQQYANWVKDGKPTLDNDTNNLMRVIGIIWKKVMELFGNTEQYLKDDMNVVAANFFNGVDSEAVRASRAEGFTKVDVDVTFANNQLAKDVLLDVTTSVSGRAVYSNIAVNTEVEMYTNSKDGILPVDTMNITVLKNELVKAQKGLTEKYNVIELSNTTVPKGVPAMPLGASIDKKLEKYAHMNTNSSVGLIGDTPIVSLLAVPKGYTVRNLEKSESGRLVKYDIVDTTNSKVGSYEAEVEYTEDGVFTKTVNEKVEGVKAVTVNLIGSNSLPAYNTHNSSVFNDTNVKFANTLYTKKSAEADVQNESVATTVQTKVRYFEEVISNISASANKLLAKGKVKVVDNATILAIDAEHKDGNYSYIGARAASAVQQKLNVAIDMHKAGKSVEDVLKNTGWELTKDGKWQHLLKTKPVLRKNTIGNGVYTLGDLVQYDELFTNYPQLQTLEVEVRPFSTTAMYKDGKIIIDTNVLANASRLEKLAILGHETQHAIQDIEGFSQGTNPTDAKKTVLFKEIMQALIKLKMNPSSVAAVLADKKNTASVVSGLGIPSNLLELTPDMAKAVKDTKEGTELEYWAMKQAYLAKLGEKQARGAEQHWSGLEVEQTYESMVYYNKKSTTGDAKVVIGGMYVPALGVSFINGEVLQNERDAVAVFYHEVAAHAYLDMVKSEEYYTLLDRVERLRERGLQSTNAKVQKFFQIVDKWMEESGSVGNKEELFAYMLQGSYALLKDNALYDMEEDVNTNIDKLRSILPEVVVNVIKQIAALYTKHMRKLFSSSSAMQTIKGIVTKDMKFNLEIQEDLLSLVEGSKRAVESVAVRRSKYKADLGAYDVSLVEDTSDRGANYIKNVVVDFDIILEMLGTCK